MSEKKRRKLLQFSLRTLCICVLLLAVCWTFTATWGRDQITKLADDDVKAHLLAVNFAAARPHKVRNAGLVEVVQNSEIVCTAPFFLSVESDAAIREIEAKIHRSDLYFWFFGYRTKVSGLAKVLAPTTPTCSKSSISLSSMGVDGASTASVYVDESGVYELPSWTKPR